MELVASPWAAIFEDFARSIRSHALIVAPFIPEEPLHRLASIVSNVNPPRFHILTNLDVYSLLDGSIDAETIAQFCQSHPGSTVRHLPGLHAKAYVADQHTAIITSGNLTRSSLYLNYEYGIRITDRDLVKRITEDMIAYGDLGTEVSLAELKQLGQLAEALKNSQANTLASAHAGLKRDFERQLEAARDSLRNVRARPGESTNSIFARTVLHVLRNGPLTTRQIHPLVESIHPDICDNSIDRVINGVRFGRRWKHMVRNAQQTLAARGLIRLVDRRWHLV